MKSNKTIGTLLTESLMIIVSILISFYLEGLRQDKNDRKKEKAYLSKINTDLSADSVHLSILQRKFELAVNKTFYYFVSYEKWSGSKILPISNDSIVSVMNIMLDIPEPFEPRSSAYSSIKSNGDIGLIENDNLSNKIVVYHERNRVHHVMMDYNDLVKNHLVPYVGTTMDVADFTLYYAKKFGHGKSDYYKLYSDHLLKSASLYLNTRAKTILRNLKVQLTEISEIKMLIKKELID